MNNDDNMTRKNTNSTTTVPHSGALGRLEEDFETLYTIPMSIASDDDSCAHELVFTRTDFEFAQRLFAILDTENNGVVRRAQVQEFTTQRCPVFWRRDDDLRKLTTLHQHQQHQQPSPTTTTTTLSLAPEDDFPADSPTFDEIWNSVAASSRTPIECSARNCSLGLEGWMVFCRFIALAQFMEAKRRFSARHSQQTMRHRNSPRGSEVVVVNVPPPEPPSPLSPEELASYEQRNQSPLPLPELDLDHSLLAAHDYYYSRRASSLQGNGSVKIELFGHASQQSASHLEFAVTFLKPDRTSLSASSSSSEYSTVVRRSMADMKWLDDTVTSHKTLGGTLCGRILPPFPKSARSSMKILPDESIINSSIKSTKGTIAAAAKGVGKITSAAKNMFGSYISAKVNSSGVVTTTPSPTQTKPSPKKSLKERGSSKGLPDGYYNPYSPAGKARQLERYMNYLLDHPALSTSFPLNAMLTASQSGLEAAKRSLDECNKAAKARREHSIPLWSGSASSSEGGGYSPDFAWVRTAAQAAMALRVHGMLETTGMPSASARLQHASLPAFGKAKNAHWDRDIPDQGQRAPAENESTTGTVESQGFEEGVIQVQSGLQSDADFENHDEAYDMLPLPVPAPERRILTVGNTEHAGSLQPDSRFHYGTSDEIDFLQFEDEENRSVLLGNLSVDDNIDKLREVIGSVDNTLSRCLGSSGNVGAARRERLRTQLDVLHGLDSWEGMRGQFVSQRALLKGVGGISQSREIYEESDLVIVDDLSWQASLAHSAVSAAEDVRSAIRASKTAANAKAAADSAAMSAQSACSNGDFATMDEARAAQTRSSIAQSHAIHAAVVDHEAKAVKRRATLALAHDVKSWNLHRKRELLKSCLSYARSQHEATRRSVDAWSSLRDGFIGTPVIHAAHDRRAAPPRRSQGSTADRFDPDEAVATIFDSTDDGLAEIVAMEHSLFTSPSSPSRVPAEASIDSADWPLNDSSEMQMPNQTDPDAPIEKATDFCDPNLILPFATASPIPEESESETTSGMHQSHSSATKLADSKVEPEKLSDSMQSLVDGLMSWGGGLDDDLPLPPGMALQVSLNHEDGDY